MQCCVLTFFVVVIAVFVSGQNINDGKYRGGDDGKYRGTDDGRYRPSSTSTTRRTTTTTTTTPRPTTTTTRATTTQPPKRTGTGTHLGGGNWQTIRQNSEINENGYSNSFETDNGIVAEDNGRIDNPGTDNEILRTSGFYQYTGDDGQLYRVDYTADENGFRAQGEHIPKTPPEIVELLAYLATAPPPSK